MKCYTINLKNRQIKCHTISTNEEEYFIKNHKRTYVTQYIVDLIYIVEG